MDILMPLIEGLVVAGVGIAVANELTKQQAPQEVLIPIPVKEKQR